MAKATKNSNSAVVGGPFKTHHARAFFAAIFGLVALLLVVVSLLVVWLNQTLTNSAAFTNTVAPLATQTDVQNFVVAQASNQLLHNAPTSDLAQALLPASEIAGKTPDQLTAAVTPAVQQTVRQVVGSASFAALWKSTVQSAHDQFMTQLNSNSPTVTLNLHPAIVGIISQLQSTKLQIVSDKMTIAPDTGQLVLKGNVIEKVRRGYTWLKEAAVLVVLLTLVAGGLCVWISVHHMATLRRIVFGAGLIGLGLAAALQAPALVAKSSDATQQKAALAVATTLLHNLQFNSLIFGLVCVGGVIISKLYIHWRARA